MATLIAENFRFLSLFFKSKDVMIFNGLVALGTVCSQELFSMFAFHCPCSPTRNYIYGLAAIGVPALALFLIGVICNNHTWNLVYECHNRGIKNFSAAANFLIFSSVMGRAAVAPVTWSVISLLRGEAYVCALSEFMDLASLDKFTAGGSADITARFPCGDLPGNLTRLKDEVIRQLKYESQVLFIHYYLFARLIYCSLKPLEGFQMWFTISICCCPSKIATLWLEYGEQRIGTSISMSQTCAIGISGMPYT